MAFLTLGVSNISHITGCVYACAFVEGDRHRNPKPFDRTQNPATRQLHAAFSIAEPEDSASERQLDFADKTITLQKHTDVSPSVHSTGGLQKLFYCSGVEHVA